MIIHKPQGNFCAKAVGDGSTKPSIL